MTTIMRKTVMAALVAGVALGAAVPAMAQQGQMPSPPMGAMMPEMGPDMGPAFDFKRFDADGDGKVTLAEIQSGRAGVAKALDANGDGKLSAEELVAAEMDQAKARIEAQVKARIAAQDSDGDGLLSAAELATRPMPAKMFERLDANKDGAVSADEMAAMRAKMEERMQGRRGGERGERGDNRGRGGDDGHRWFRFGHN